MISRLELKAKSSKLKAFTLIEMMVVIAVLSILTSMLVVYTRTSDKQIKLITEQAKIIGVILRSKSLALQTYKEGVAACGYGVHFTPPNQYLIFKEPKPCVNRTWDSKEELVGQTHELPQEIKFSELPLKDILFVPPEPKIYFDGALATDDKIITIMFDNVSASIGVNKVGQVTAE